MSQEENSLLAWHRAVPFSSTEGAMAISTLKFAYYWFVSYLVAMVNTKALTTDKGCMQDAHLMVQRERELATKWRLQPIKALIRCLNIWTSVSHLESEQRKYVVTDRKKENKQVTYFFPFISDPSVVCALCSLARPRSRRMRASVTQVLEDSSRTF